MTTKKNTYQTEQNVKNLADNVKEAANSQFDSVAKNLRETAETAGAEVRKYMNTAGEQLDVAAKDIKKAIRKEPLKATAITAGVAAVVGFVAGAFTRRK